MLITSAGRPRRPGGGLPGRGGAHAVDMPLAPALITTDHRAGAAPVTTAIDAPERAGADGACVQAGAVTFLVFFAARLIACLAAAGQRAVKAARAGAGRQAAAALRAGPSFHTRPAHRRYLRISAAAVQGQRPAQIEKKM